MPKPRSGQRRRGAERSTARVIIPALTAEVKPEMLAGAGDGREGRGAPSPSLTLPSSLRLGTEPAPADPRLCGASRPPRAHSPRPPRLESSGYSSARLRRPPWRPPRPPRGGGNQPPGSPGGGARPQPTNQCRRIGSTRPRRLISGREGPWHRPPPARAPTLRLKGGGVPASSRAGGFECPGSR